MSARTELHSLFHHIYGHVSGTIGVFSGKRAPGGGRLLQPRDAYFDYPAEIDQVTAWLVRESANGREAFMCAHLLTRRQRTKESAALVAALYVDGDGAEVPADFPQPTAIVQSSPGKKHYYWALSRAAEPQVAERLNKRLAYGMNADKSGWDLGQLLRPPGTVNHKYEERPQVVLLSVEEGRSWDPEELERILPKVPPGGKGTKPRARHRRQSRLEPPVPLTGDDLRTWHGELPVLREDGDVDRSRSLFAMGAVLARRGVQPADIVKALAERDQSLGWEKYTDRADAEVQYGRIVDKLREDCGEHAQRTAQLGEEIFTELRAAAHPEEIVQRVLDDKDLLLGLALAAAQDETAWDALVLNLGGRCKRSVLEHLTRAVKRTRATLAAIATSQEASAPPSRILDCLPDAPVGDRAIVPPGWVLGPDGISYRRGSGQGHRVVPSPVVIMSGGKDVEDRTEFLEIAWVLDGSWTKETVERKVVASGREIVSLASVGFPVTSQNAGELVQYLSEYEALNREHYPKTHVSHRLGWQGDEGRGGFLLGHELIAPGDGPPTQFRGRNTGDAQVARGFSSSGSAETWTGAVAAIQEYPTAMFTLYASIAPVLLGVLDVQNFVVDLSYGTSSGKTTALRVAASAWGSPDESSGASPMMSWDTTRVAIERAAEILSHLPLILDETKRAKSPRDVSRVIYDFVSGRGRGRGAPDGMRPVGSWHGILLSTGEAPATSLTEDGGTRARVITIWGPPFGATDRCTGDAIRRLNEVLRQNYGHAGPAVVQFVAEHRERWDELRDRHREATRRYLDQAGDSEVAGRLAPCVAAVEVAAQVTHEALGLDWPLDATFAEIWSAISRELQDVDRAEAALRLVVDWAVANQARFYGCDSDGEESPVEHLGRWDAGDNWSHIGFVWRNLKDLLQKEGFDAEAVRRQWRERGWTLRDREGRDTNVRIGRGTSRVVAVKREVVEQYVCPQE